MLKIRLQRKGKRNKAFFNVVVTEHTIAPKGKYLELLGSYDPHSKTLTVEKDRIEYWMGKGAQLSPTANNIFVEKEIIKGKKVTSWKPKKKTEEEKKATPQISKKTEDIPAQETKIEEKKEETAK